MKRSQTVGFTVIELLIAFGILALMMFLIDQLFFSTSRAITQGVALTNLIHHSNTISEQISRDSEEMMGPGTPTGGFLVILNHKIRAPRLRESSYYAETGSSTPPQIRSDQLVFIYDNVSNKILEPMCPMTKVDFWNSTSANYVRMWYGHVRRTNESGTDEGTSDLGQPGNNRVASQWVLGRQALFLTESVDGNSGGIIRNDNNTGSTTNKKIDGLYNTAVQGYGSVGSNGFPRSVSLDTGGLVMYKGLSDIAAWDLGPDSDTGGSPKNTLLWYLKHGGLGNHYINEIYKVTYGYERLRTNPSPRYDPGVANYEYQYAAWQIAQMHSFFVEHVSDFEVSFAGDYDGIVGVDLDSNNNILWYDTWNPPPAGTYRSSVGSSTNEFYHQSGTQLPTGFLPDGAWVWRHDDVGAASKWPHLLRIRYRMHDPRGEFVSYDGSTGFSTPGMWFESILAVNRP